MNYFHNFSKKAIFSKVLGVFFSLMFLIPGATLQAASDNLIKNPSFEQGNVNTYWDLWNNKPEERTYTMYRSYEVPFGAGSYSAAINATGPVSNVDQAGIVTKSATNPIPVNSDKSYHFSLYTKASETTTVSVYLQNAETYEALGPVQTINVGTNWEKKLIIFQPTDTVNASLGLSFGNLQESNTLYFDNLDFRQNNLTLTTKDVGGFIGQSKTITITGNSSMTTSDIQMEVPYLNPLNNNLERKKISPNSVTTSGVATFTIPAQTYSGIGKVYFFDTLIGELNYNVFAKVTEVSPEPVRPDEDLVVYGSGFNPDITKNAVLVKKINIDGTLSDTLLQPHMVDSSLSQMVVKLPVGMANSKLGVRTYFTNTAGVTVENKSNLVNYTIMPVIYGATWTERGHEAVGDKLSITGKGIVYKPVVHFYSESDELVGKKNAIVKKIVSGTENYEVIEVVTPVSLNKIKITVKSGLRESDKEAALSYSAKPTITSIKTAHKRNVGNNSIVQAAKVGETIRLQGQGFKTTSPAIVEFWSMNGGVITTTIDPSHIDTKGTWVDVVVPAGIQNGQVNIKINDLKSNNVSLELIPTVISSLPIEPVPGSELVITAQGVALDVSQITIHFKLSNNEEIKVHPTQVTNEGDNVLISVMTPAAIPNQGSSMKIQYGYWLNDETYSLSVAPRIESATINTDTKILTIKGYGFSSVVNNNKITYKYADGTVVTPKTKMLGVFSTSEGQEIRVNILDDYYYGHVYVTVGEVRSNEVSVGPAVITRLERRIQFVQANNKVMGVLYISGRNFGTEGDVKVGDVWATTHYRTNTFIIAVVERQDVYKNPVIITKQ